MGHFLPCFACPYVGTCAGNCYLMALQGSQWGVQIPFAEIVSVWTLGIAGMFVGFLLLAIIFSKLWCGWICPFGTLQDWISSIRKKLGIRESRFSWSTRDNLKSVKYIILAILIIVPVFIANGGLHPDFKLPFCQICPAKLLMPLFSGTPKYFAIDTTNPITTVMTAASIVVTAGVLIGMIFKERFFCLFCPLLALISIFQRIGLLRLKKRPDACTGCRNCHGVCPVDIRQVHLQKENVFTQDCILCLKCVEACPQDGTLSLRLLNKDIFSSSKKYIWRQILRKCGKEKL